MLYISSKVFGADVFFSLSTGSAVSLTGSWRPSPNNNIQAHELHVEDAKLLGSADPAVRTDKTLFKPVIS